MNKKDKKKEVVKNGSQTQTVKKRGGGCYFLQNYNKQERFLGFRTCLQDSVVNDSNELGHPVSKEYIYKHCVPSMTKNITFAEVI